MVISTESPLSISLRKATPEDAEAVAKLGAAVFATTYGHAVPPRHIQSYIEETYSVRAVTKDISNPQKDVFLATLDNGAVVGFSVLTRGSSSLEPCVSHLPDTAELQRLYIDTAFHRKGVGRRLASWVESEARAQGFRHLWLSVWEGNTTARKIYERFGYRKVGYCGFDVGGGIQRDRVMLKEL
ncbi:acyl-CoA N-acyltransferase [Sodiomyces alkalinus F11]|uniref:Acyl-CoA N-acyltransferase n=1 Tax=Sodiomyces alkalinus (strain CBS 110278 / VKM F-3762 / F11) TaxID=1314773 RepID=A0A3N2QAA6_SODAK|nr:acyl-CoA N-acyltransferase [Sodiomyces alkalinus F11]ROT43681.1 acyl-CoA N-acyltransferase [Sodiomyces alkalinus F11]